MAWRGMKGSRAILIGKKGMPNGKVIRIDPMVASQGFFTAKSRVKACKAAVESFGRSDRFA